MRIKSLSQIIIAVSFSVLMGLFARQLNINDDLLSDSCNRDALDAVASGGYLLLADDCVLVVSPAIELTGRVVIEGGMLHGNGVDRIVIVAEDAVVTLRDVTILSGSVELDPPYGGGVYNAGILLIENSRLVANSAQQGGAIYNAETGILSIRYTEIARNRAREGAGIYNRGRLSIVRSQIQDNVAQSVDNYGGYGAGIVNKGNAQILYTLITNNRGDGEGIGIDTSRALSIRYSVIMDNQCTIDVCAGTDIFRFEGIVRAQYNYWGSADGPSPERVVGLDESSYIPYLQDLPDWAQ